MKELLSKYPDAKVYSNQFGHEELTSSRKNHSFYLGTPFEIDNYRKVVLKNERIIHFDGFCEIEALWTPGHDESCISYKVDKYLFTGDSYIPGVRVFTGFIGGNKETALASQQLLMRMELSGLIVLCGHHTS